MKIFFLFFIFAASIHCTAQVTITTFPNSPSCAGSMDGSISFDFSDINNNPNYTVYIGSFSSPFDSLEFSSNSGNGFFSLLSGGVYQIFVVDANNDTTSTLVTVSQMPPIYIAVYDSTSYNGTLTIVASGGNPPYMYSINFGANPQFSNLFTGLPPGNYYSGCVVTDSYGCESSWYTVYTYIPPYNCSVNLSSIGTECSSQAVADGEIEWSLNAPNPASEHTIYLDYPGGQLDSAIVSPGVYSGSFTGLPHDVNNYGVYMHSDSSCTDTNYVNVSYAPPTVVSVNIDVHQECGPCTHWLDWTYSDSAYNGPYEVFFYDITSGSVLLSNYIIPSQNSANSELDLCPGDYVVYVVNNVGDTASFPSTINDNLLSATINQIISADQGQLNGSISVNASGGSPSYLYSIDAGLTWQTANTFTGLGAGTYTILIQDASGCETSLSVVVDELSTDGIIEQDIDLNIYPNPTSEHIYCETDEVFDYLLIDSGGGIVKSGLISKKDPVNIEDLAPGMYILNLANASQSVKLKILIE